MLALSLSTPSPVPVMLNCVAFSSCRRRSSSQSPAPSTPLEEEKGGRAPSLGLGERGLQTVLAQTDERHTRREEDMRETRDNSTTKRRVTGGGSVLTPHPAETDAALTHPREDGKGAERRGKGVAAIYRMPLLNGSSGRRPVKLGTAPKEAKRFSIVFLPPPTPAHFHPSGT